MLKKNRVLLSLLFILGVSSTLIAKESLNDYFPHMSGSFWIYEDQDRNKLTRRAVEGKAIEGETYHAFNYESTLEDWADYEYYIRPDFYQICPDGIAFFVGDGVEKAFEARLRKKMEAEQGISTTGEVSVDVSYEIEVEAKDDFYLLPTPILFDKTWTATQISGSVTLKLEIQSSIPNLQISDGDQEPIPIALVEKGKVAAKETVKTSAGTFEDCLRIEYWYTEATEKGDTTEDISGIELTTLWLAPNVGIVKFTHKSADAKVEKSLELTQYEIKPTGSSSE